MKYSLTMGGILVSVVGTLLVQWFSQECANEIITQIPLLVGGVVAWIGRVRQGDVTLLGVKK